MTVMRRLGFRIGSDEMYLHISGLAARLSWATLVVVLLGWSIYDGVRLHILPAQFVVLGLGLIVYWTVYLLVLRDLTGSHEE
ncbi:MAG TPA: hypothetical protein VHS28_07295 [Chloroflexota bacterium]|nr:hypothetical protein [Chloroflexota bacterium]